MSSFIPCIIFLVIGIVFGIFVTLTESIAHDKREDKRMEERVKNAYPEWCSKNCIRYAECFGNIKDPDKAWEKLLDNFCCECPIENAQELIFEEEEKHK